MKRLRRQYDLRMVCRVLAVSNGYYAWGSRKPLWRSYGPKRLQKELQADAYSAGMERIKRWRNKLGLRCAQRRTLKAMTNANHPLPITPKGWLYLAG
jgi:putative transposase